jgi:predicted phosphate transport protein (TIGR00153 family)
MDILGKKKSLIAEIDQFWDAISQAALVFNAGADDFFDHKLHRLKVRLDEIHELENKADNLRRSIKYKVYSQMLIPDSRGDVLGLLETSDNVIDRTKKILNSLDIEKPVIPENLLGDFKELAEAAANAVDEMVKAARAFFNNSKIINDFINKVFYYEHEADKLEEMIKRKAFESEEIDMLSRRVQIRYFAEKISLLADDAEDVCERLTIYNIKRSV